MYGISSVCKEDSIDDTATIAAAAIRQDIEGFYSVYRVGLRRFRGLALIFRMILNYI